MIYDILMVSKTVIVVFTGIVLGIGVIVFAIIVFIYLEDKLEKWSKKGEGS